MADILFICCNCIVFHNRMPVCPRLRPSVRGIYGTGIHYWLGRVGGYLGVLGLRASLARKVLRLAASEHENFAASRRFST
jgi:hypothetical protein